MANMITTVQTYDLDGVTTEYPIHFDYLARKFVIVTLIGQDRKVLKLNEDYRFAEKRKLSLTRAWGVADGYDLIEIRRITSATDRLVDFSDGSILRAIDLNISAIQALHVAEEARDLTADTIAINNDGDLDARGKRIVNVADAINDGDALNLRTVKRWNESALTAQEAAKGYSEVSLAHSKESERQKNLSLNAAKSSQEAANESAASASESASSANASAGSALQSSGSASKSEDCMKKACECASKATISEENAKVAAETATAKAKEASTSAASASTSEKNAKASASGAANSAATATTASTAAAESEAAAKTSATAAKASQDSAEASKVSALASKDAAAKSATAASTSSTEAKTSATDAKASETKSTTEANRAKTEADRAEQAADDAVAGGIKPSDLTQTITEDKLKAPSNFATSIALDDRFKQNMELGDIDLNTLYGKSNQGVWGQKDTVRATPDRNYPRKVAGTLIVLFNNTNRRGSIQVYYPYNNATPYTRSLSALNNVWSEWSIMYSSGNTSIDPNGVLTTKQATVTLTTNDLAKESGNSHSKVMTQKAVTEALEDKVSEGTAPSFTDVTITSDRRAKENINVIDKPLERLSKLKGSTFNYKDSGNQSGGIIAQDLLEALPEGVDQSDPEHLKVHYNAVIGLLVNAVNELSDRIKSWRIDNG